MFLFICVDQILEVIQKLPEHILVVMDIIGFLVGRRCVTFEI